MFIKEKNILVCGVDHGFSTIKTEHFVFPNGVEKYGGKTTMLSNTMKYNSVHYKVGEGRLALKDTKTSDDDYLLLTFAAIANEIEEYNLPTDKRIDVVLGAGLPFTRFGDEKEEFYKYLKRGNSNFNYEGKYYQICIKEVYLFPQCYAAVANILGKLAPEQLIVDIGSKTIDMIYTNNFVPVERNCITIPEALIHCMSAINKSVYRKKNCNLTERQMQEVMITGSAYYNRELISIVQDELRIFAKNVEGKIKESGFNLKLTPIIYVGGGATVMKYFGSIRGSNICYQEDVKANAIGYEYLASNKVMRWGNE